MTAEEFEQQGKSYNHINVKLLDKYEFAEAFAEQEIKELREENEQLMEQNSAAIKDYNDLLVETQDLREAIEMAKDELVLRNKGFKIDYPKATIGYLDEVLERLNKH